MVYCERCPHGVVCLLSVPDVCVGLYCVQMAEAEQIKMPFGGKTRGTPRRIVLEGVGVGTPHTKGVEIDRYSYLYSAY